MNTRVLVFFILLYKFSYIYVILSVSLKYINIICYDCYDLKVINIYAYSFIQNQNFI